MSEMFVGIDLGGTNIKIGLFDSELKLISKTSVATKVDMGPNVVIDKMAQTAKKLLAEAGFSLQDVVAVGIGTPGPAKYSEGIIIKSTNMPTFKNVPICRMLKEKLGAPIVFDNDANVACWGEYTVGAGKGVKDMVFFTLGTGRAYGNIPGRQKMQLRPKRLCGGVCIRRLDGKESTRGHRGRGRIQS